MTASETAKNIHAPTPCVLKKSGIPSKVKVLNKVAAKVKNPRSAPKLESAIK